METPLVMMLHWAAPPLPAGRRHSCIADAWHHLTLGYANYRSCIDWFDGCSAVVQSKQPVQRAPQLITCCWRARSSIPAEPSSSSTSSTPAEIVGSRRSTNSPARRALTWD